MSAVEIVSAKNISADALALLIAESEQQGWTFLRRLGDELASGVNRFNRSGEALFLARDDETIVGVCGLNADPYTTEPSVGRVRRLYVLLSHRGQGIGQRLVQEVISAARGTFHLLRVRTENPQAARLYERLGFRQTCGIADCTHVMEFTGDK